MNLLPTPREKEFLCSRMIGYKPHVGEIKKTLGRLDDLYGVREGFRVFFI